MNDKDSKDSITEGENLEEDEEEEEGGAETEEQSGNESEVNEPEEEVTLILILLCIKGMSNQYFCYSLLAEALLCHRVGR